MSDYADNKWLKRLILEKGLALLGAFALGIASMVMFGGRAWLKEQFVTRAEYVESSKINGEKLDKVIDLLQKNSVFVALQSDEHNTIAAAIKDHENRIRILEGRPSK